MDITLLSEDIINEIGENAGFRMWNKRNKNKGYYQLNSEYSYDYYSNGPPNKNWIFSKTDFIRNEKYNVSSYVDWEITTNLKPHPSLLQFKIVGDYYNYIGVYTINLKNLKPTKNSSCQTKLSDKIITKIKTIYRVITLDVNIQLKSEIKREYEDKKDYDTRSQKEFDDEQDDARSIMRECGYGSD